MKRVNGIAAIALTGLVGFSALSAPIAASADNDIQARHRDSCVNIDRDRRDDNFRVNVDFRDNDRRDRQDDHHANRDRRDNNRGFDHAR